MSCGRLAVLRRATALVLVWVMSVSSVVWAAPPRPRPAGPPPNPTPYVPVEPPILQLARAFEETSAWSPPEVVSRPVVREAAPPPPLVQEPALPRRIAAFAFGADEATVAPYVKIVQGGPGFLYDPARGYGYTDVDGLDDSPNDRDVLDPADEIYDQLIGAKPPGADIAFRVDVPNGTYRFVAAGGDPRYTNHLTTVRVRDGHSGNVASLVEDFANPNAEFWRVGFDGREPPPAAVAFAPLADSPTLAVTRGFVEIRQIAAMGEGAGAGGDLNLLELWLVEEAPPTPEPPPDLAGAFAFGADSFTRESPNAPGVLYTKVVQDGANFLYSQERGFGYTDVSGLDTSLNNREVLTGPDEIYDQLIGAKPAGARIVFRADVPNGVYRLVLAGGDAKYTNHETTILARDGSDGATYPLVTALRNPERQFYRIGFDGKHPPMTPAVHFLPLSTSPFVEATKGYLEIHQVAGDGEGVGAGGDLSLLEIWSVDPEPLPEDFVAAFAFGADEFTRESPNAPVPYVKVVQGGANFTYDPARGYGYSDLSGLDGSPNDRNVLDGPEEIYDQFIGAKPAGASIVFRVDVPPGDYRFVAAGGDARYTNHRTTVRARDGSSGTVVTFVEDVSNPEREFFRVGFDDRHAPEAAGVSFHPEIDSPTLVVTTGHIEIVQTAAGDAAAGGDLSLLEVWRAQPLVQSPTVALELPEDGGFLTSGDVPVRVRFENATTLRFLVDGMERTSELTVGPELAEGVLAIEDGAHDIEAVAENAGGVATASAMFTVDTEAPTVELDPLPDYVNTGSLSVTGNLRDRDPGASVDCASSLTLETTSLDGVREWSFTCAVDLTEGANVVSVTASDTGGRQATAAANVTLDTAPPQLTIVSPTPDTYSMASTIDVSGGVFDDSPVTVRVGALDASVSGTSFSALDVPLSAPTNVIPVVATDAAGNSFETSVTVFLDTEAPTVTIGAPVEGAILASPFTVTGTVSDPAGVVLVNVNGEAVMADAGSFTTTLSALDGALEILARAQDGAGNEGSASVRVTVDSSPPVLDVTSPADGFVTNVAELTLDGTVTDATAVTLSLNGAPTGSAFPVETTLAEGPNPLELVATDAAGNASSVSLGVVLDTVAPSLQVLTPAEGDVLAELPVLVQGTVTDATPVSVSVDGEPAVVTGNAWQIALGTLLAGDAVVEIVATDAAGNSASETRSVFLDVDPPVLNLTSPTPGLLTNASSIDVSGTVSDASAVTVTVNGAPVLLDAGSFVTAVALADGDNPIRVVATDAAGRTSEANVVVTQDAVPPTIELTTPDAVSGITSGAASALVTDDLAVAEVSFGVGGAPAETFFGPPYEIELAVPDGVLPGDTLVVTVTATDTAGNVAAASRGVAVIEDGVVVGQVLDDTTSLPLEGATVTLGPRSAVTGPDGRYSLPTGEAEVVLVAEKTGMTTVERRTSVLSDVGTVPVDARLTPISGDVTPLSAQGLPALLPLGWSPLSAMHASVPTQVSVPENAYLARYRDTLHEWVMLSLAGPLDVDVTEPGAYAVIVPDEGVVVPAPGEMLDGVEPELLPASATAEGVVDPPVLPPSGGIAAGTLSLFSPIALPSGTVIQAEITERFALASGELASEETRLEDIVLFQVPRIEPDAALSATFPIASSLTETRGFDASEIVSGEVNLDLLAGREAVRGVRGGSRATSLDEGEFRIDVPSSALPEDTAVDLQTFDGLSEFVPAESGLDPLGELVVDLSGRTLALGAELSLAVAGLSPDDSYVLARVARIDGVPRMEYVTVPQLSGDRLVASNVRDEGRYVFYRVAGPVGFVAGTTTPPGAVVETSGLPFIAFSDGSGAYRTVALTGSVDVTATVPRTSLRAVEPADVLEGQTTPVDLALTGQLTTATVTPEDGALGVAVSTQIDVTTTTALDPATVVTDNVRLLEGGTTPLPVRLVLSGSGKSLAVVPETNLAHATSYTLDANTLADVFGGAVTIPATTFTTRSKNTLAVTESAVSFSLPNDGGIVQVTATGLPLGTTVLIVNAGNGVVASFTYAADGLLGELPASISDRLLVTLTDPAGSTVTFEKSKFVGEDGTTAIGPGGGTVEGPGGVELRIPEGALREGVELEIQAFDETFLPADEFPELVGATFGAGVEVTSEDMPSFDEEVDLVFPRPADAPDGAFYYVYRKFESESGLVQWETIDHAFVEEGDEKVVTASFPFAGFVTTFALTSLFVLVWTHDAGIPDRATSGVVTGKVLRTVLVPGKTAPVYEEIPNVQVHAVSGFGKENGTFAVSREDGTYTFWDNTFRDGPVRVRAEVNGGVQEATAYAINVEDDGVDPLRFYENVATANLTFPPEAPRPPPPAIDVVIFKRNTEGEREPIDGLVLDTDSLVIGFVTQDTVQQATINGEVFFVRRDTTDDRVDWVLDRDFVPGRPGAYTVETTAIAPDQSIKDVAVTFRAIAAGSSNDEVLNDDPPAVITLETVPKNDAGGVPVDVFPQATFTEPVKNLPGNVRLVDSAGEDVGFVLSGVLRGGDPIADIQSAGAEVTAITLRPMTGLKFGERYTLTLSDAIEDLDTNPDGSPAPKNLVPFTSTFTTFGPETLGGTDEKFGSAGIAVIGNRAFLVENHFYSGTLRVFDIEDPVTPREIPEAQAFVSGRPVDIAADPDNHWVVIATGPTNKSRPSNLYIFDVTNPYESRWVGAASVASSAEDGFVQRIDLLDGKAYVLTGRKGIHVVDLDEAVGLFAAATGGDPSSPGALDVRRRLDTAGQGFGQEAVRQPVPLSKDDTRQWFQQDLSASRIQSDTWVGMTGEAPLVLVDAGARTTTGSVPIVVRDGTGQIVGSLTSGYAIALGTVHGRELAIVAGWGTTSGAAGWSLAVVDVTEPDAPFTTSIIPLPLDASPSAILLSSDVAIVASESRTVLVGLSDPEMPRVSGTIDAARGMLAATDPTLLLSTPVSRFGEAEGSSGLNTIAMARMTIITALQHPTVVVARNRASIEPQLVRYRALFPSGDVESSELDMVLGGTTLRTLPAPLDENGTGQIVVPVGTLYPTGNLKVRLVVNRDLPDEPEARERFLFTDEFIVEVLPDTEDLPTADSLGNRTVDVVAYSGELIRRATEPARDVQPEALTLRWGADNGSSILPNPVQSSDGFFAGLMETSTLAGTEHIAAAFVGDLLLDDSLTPDGGPLVVGPGEASQVTFSGTGVDLPADGITEITVTATVLDAVDNPVAEGTPVFWDLEGYGELVTMDTEVDGLGRAQCVYRAGLHTSAELISLQVDDILAETSVNTFEVTATLITDRTAIHPDDTVPIELTLLVDSPAGPPADGMKVDWSLASNGHVFDEDDTVVDGRATARWLPFFDRLGWISAIVETTQASVTIDVTAGVPALTPKPDLPESPLRLTVSDVLLVGDRTGDGTSLLEIEPGIVEEVQYRSSSTVELSGGLEGDLVTLSLGSAAGPNVEPRSWYRGESLVDGRVHDVYLRHPGQADESVQLDNLHTSEGDSSYLLDGTGAITVPDAPGLSFRSDFQLSIAARPIAADPDQSLIEKAGNYSLRLYDDGLGLRAAFDFIVSGVAQSLESPLRIDLNTWHSISVRYVRGRLVLSVDGQESALPLTELLDTTSAPLLLGSGFVGNLDDVRLLDLSPGVPRLLAFENGEDEVEVELGPGGTASVRVFSQGAFQGGPAPLQTASLLQELPPEDDQTLREQLNNYFVDLRIEHEFALRRIQGREARFWVMKEKLAIPLARLFQGAIAGSDFSDPVAVVGDLIVSLTLIPGTLRDLTLAIDALVKGKAGTGEAVTLTIVALLVLAAIGKRVRFVARSALFLQRVKTRSYWIWSRWVMNAVENPALEARFARTMEIILEGRQAAQEAAAELIDMVGASSRRADQLENVLKHSDEAEDVALSLNKARLADGTKRAKEMIGVMGACAIGAVTATVAALALIQTPPACPNWTTKASEGVAIALNSGVVRESSLLTARVNRIVAGKTPAQGPAIVDVFEKVAEVARAHPVNLNRLIKRLGGRRASAIGELLVLDYAFVALKGNKIGFEFFQQLATAAGRQFRRFYDIVELNPFSGLPARFYELKNWATFPPQSFFNRAWRQAQEQWLRDVASHAESSPQVLRWVLPGSLRPLSTTIRQAFVDLLHSPKLRSYMLKDNPTPAQIETYRSTIRAITDQIDEIVIFHP